MRGEVECGRMRAVVGLFTGAELQLCEKKD